MIATLPDPLRQRVLEKIEAMRPAFEQMPGVVVVNDLRDGSVIYMSPKGLELLGVTLGELQEMGPGYHERFFNPEQAEEYVPALLDLFARNDPSENITFFQQVRFKDDPEWQWHLSALRIFAHDDAGKPVALLSISQHLAPEHHYTRKVARLMEELNFLKEHLKTFEALSTREREVLKLMALGRSAQEIADKLHISVLTANTHRKNIRRKLGVQRSSDLANFARAFDLV
ncbi:MAG: LuxR family transcriptional regulator [Chitinophagaceae bacterium]|nr:MAG: LuxR family transcriptional regulator [Chitinophagaceae bacterium]